MKLSDKLKGHTFSMDKHTFVNLLLNGRWRHHIKNHSVNHFWCCIYTSLSYLPQILSSCILFICAVISHTLLFYSIFLFL
ncbi:hypothetical protein, unlikely [Trypanosoma brucei brucei TREU927]|uniref:Uncharacterized protein n=1 Tax=Trypanosoma brucei brucei (strain 927/4 GUTat10.1) TaxID=185431 RepID=Q38G19_TRYB2|nr:hypothetical protein, unlikely [Trypanosoma brucei brucei TREU927]EAN76251.1 hypothetical protein, unlikely [Trypanosoma brucei brucei TREU927]